MIERWKDIIHFEGAYQISNLGEVKSIERIHHSKNNSFRKCKGGILKQGNCNGYKQVNLSFNGIKK